MEQLGSALIYQVKRMASAKEQSKAAKVLTQVMAMRLWLLTERTKPWVIL